MAHEIESMFYVGETPWHGLGQRLIETPTIGDAIAAAGLDWSVSLKDLYIADQTPPPNVLPFLDANYKSYKPTNKGKAVIRESDQTILGIVGDRYRPLQNRDAFNWFQPFVDSGLVDLETAGSLRDGQRVWILARIKGDDLRIVGDDLVRRFILLSNSHDGTMAIRLGFTPVRVVCANTLAISHNSAASQLIRVRHTARAKQDLDMLRDVMNLANQNFEATADQYRLLAQRQICQSDLKAYVKTCLGYETTKDDELSTKAANQIDNVTRLFSYGRGNNMTGVNGTVWAAYNAVTEYLTHEAGSDADKRYNSLWFGSSATKNTTALNEALKLCA